MKGAIPFALSCVLSVTAVASPPPIPVAAASAVFARRHALCSTDGGRLWGVSLCGPLMLADPKTHAAIANVPVPGAQRVGVYYRFTLPANVPIGNAPLEYDHIHFAQIIWPLAGNRDEQAVTLMHESFHRIQPKLGFVVKGARNAVSLMGGDQALDTQTGRIWLRGEIHALRVALTSRGAARTRALADALAMRAYRHKILPSTVAPEHILDIMEGLAESNGIDAGLHPSRRLVYTLHDMRTVENSPSYARAFFFAIGPAYSELLDAVEPSWRRKVTMKTSIAALAANTYGITVVTPSASSAQAVLARYGGSEIEREEAARAAGRRALNARYRAELITGSTLQLPLRHFKIAFDPAEEQHLDHYGSVYHHLMVSAPWGRIVVSHGDAMINRKFTALTVVAPPSRVGSTLRGRGWHLNLSPGSKIVPEPDKPGSYTVALDRAAASLRP